MHTWWPPSIGLGTTHSKAVIGSCSAPGWPPAGGPSWTVAVKIKLPTESPDSSIVPMLATAAYRRLNRSSAVESGMCQPSVRTCIDWEGPEAWRSSAAWSRPEAVRKAGDEKGSWLTDMKREKGPAMTTLTPKVVARKVLIQDRRTVAVER